MSYEVGNGGELDPQAHVAAYKAVLRQEAVDTAAQHHAREVELAAELAGDDPVAAQFLCELVEVSHQGRMQRLARTLVELS
jgi:hypothetical protein